MTVDELFSEIATSLLADRIVVTGPVDGILEIETPKKEVFHVLVRKGGEGRLSRRPAESSTSRDVVAERSGGGRPTTKFSPHCGSLGSGT